MSDTDPTQPRPRAARSDAAQHAVHDRPRWLKRIVGAAFVIAALALLVFAWLPKPVAVDVAIVDRGPLLVTVDEDGRARVKDRYVVSAPLSGNLARLDLHPGDAVKESAVIARIVPLSSPLLDERSRLTARASLDAAKAARRQTLAQVERTQSALDFATAEAARFRGLLQQNVASQRDLDQALLQVRTLTADLSSARFGVKVASHQLEMAQAALGYLKKGGGTGDSMQVTSPVEGRVLKVMQESEGVIQAGAPLLEVGDPAALEVVVDILTSDAVQIRSGARVSLERWGGKPLEGSVRLVEPSAFTRVSSLGVEEQRVNVIVDLESPRPDWQALGDGYRVEARIVVWEGKNALRVPASAVFRTGERWSVFGVEDGRAIVRPVEIGQRNSGSVEIRDGLAEGSRVIVHPSDSVVAGSAVVGR